MSDDDIAEIRERHSRDDRWRNTLPQSHDDRATLLAEVARLRADRRERIATAALQGLLSEGDLRGEPQIWAKRATVFADALIAELDKEEGKP